MPGIPYFKPPFPAVRLCCNLCGKEHGAQDLASERSRAMGEAERQGDFLFCKNCQPAAAEVAQLVERHRAARFSAVERELAAELPALVAGWVADLTGQRVESPTPAPMQGRRGRPRTEPGSIPDPNSHAR